MASKPTVLDTLTALVKVAHFGKMSRYMVQFSNDGETKRKAFCRKHLYHSFKHLHPIAISQANVPSSHFSWFTGQRAPENADELITQMTHPDVELHRGFIFDIVSPTVYQCCQCARVKHGPPRQHREHHEDWMSKPHHKR